MLAVQMVKIFQYISNELILTVFNVEKFVWECFKCLHY